MMGSGASLFKKRARPLLADDDDVIADDTCSDCSSLSDSILPDTIHPLARAFATSRPRRPKRPHTLTAWYRHRFTVSAPALTCHARRAAYSSRVSTSRRSANSGRVELSVARSVSCVTARSARRTAHKPAPYKQPTIVRSAVLKPASARISQPSNVLGLKGSPYTKSLSNFLVGMTHWTACVAEFNAYVTVALICFPCSVLLILALSVFTLI